MTQMQSPDTILLLHHQMIREEQDRRRYAEATTGDYRRPMTAVRAAIARALVAVATHLDSPAVQLHRAGDGRLTHAPNKG